MQIGTLYIGLNASLKSFALQRSNRNKEDYSHDDVGLELGFSIGLYS